MRLRDVLAKPELRLALLTGSEYLDRPVARVYTTDLLDPRRYLSGGELVLTGLMWRRTPADSETFAAALAEAGVAAVGAGDAALGSVPADLVDACTRHGLALFEVPVEVSFRAVTDEIASALWRDRATGLASVLGRQRDLMTAMASGGRLADLLPALAREHGVACWILSATGREVAGTDDLPEPVRAELARAFLSADRLPRDVTVDGTPFSVFGAPGPRLAAWFLAFTPPGGLPEIADELATLVALARAQHDEGARVERRLAADLVAAVGTVDAASRMRSCGLSTEVPFRILVGDVPALVEELARTVSPTAVVTDAVAGEVVAVLPGSFAMSRVRDAAAILAVGLRSGADRLIVGVSEPGVGPGRLLGALEEARYAFRHATSTGTPVVVVSSTDLASYPLLLAGVSATARRSFRERLLGPLLEYDLTHHADLVRTLDAYLSSSGSWSRCAQDLHVHVNTLRYRIRRIEELTGRDLGRFDDRVDLFLALRLPSVD